MFSSTRLTCSPCYGRLACLLALLACWPASAATVYTPANAPETPALEDLPLVNSIAKDDVTWTFDRAVRAGQFVNGDWYVVGPVVVTAIDPAPANGRNGSVRNLPAINNRTGFDSRTDGNRYDASLRDDPPVALNPGDALVSSISVETVGVIPRILKANEPTYSPVRTVSVLTCLAGPVAADAFRPSYCDRGQTLYYARDLRRERLPSLPRVAATEPLSEFEGYLRRPWIDTLFFEYDFPIEYMAQYPRETLRVTGMSALLLMEDFSPEQKEDLLVYLVQYGIDLYGILEAGYPGWHAHGGHGNGRKWPLVFAGVMLGRREMAWINRTFPEAWFSEDQQTMYSPCWTGATVVYAGHYGSEGHPSHPGWGPYEHLQPAEWLENCIGESYRRCCTSIGWVQVGLAAMLLQARDCWSHPAFFDYCDRWMTEDDTQHLAAILQQTGRDFSASWARQRQCWDEFPRQMWITYRDAIDAPRVAGRHLFYNNSSFDGQDVAANAADDAAIAPDKQALLPGETADFANYSSYARGVNGVMVDLVGVAGPLTADDFCFRVGASADTLEWTPGPAPTSVTVRHGAGVGGSDRVSLTFADGAIVGQWLQVTVKASARTNLTTADVFYFGNAVGETGDDPADARVDATDLERCASHPEGLALEDFIVLKQHYNADVPVGTGGDYTLDGHVDINDFILLKRAYHTAAGPDNPYDFDRDGRVNAADRLLAESGLQTPPLTLIEDPF